MTAAGTRTLVGIGILLLLPSIPQEDTAAAARLKDGQELLRRTEEAYRSLHAYREEFEWITIAYPEDEDRRVVRHGSGTFSFTRPNTFTIETNLMVVTSDGKVVTIIGEGDTEPREVPYPEDGDVTALDGLWWQTLPVTLPCLLGSPPESRPSPDSLAAVQWIKEEELHGEAGWRILCTLKDERVFEIWISQATGLMGDLIWVEDPENRTPCGGSVHMTRMLNVQMVQEPDKSEPAPAEEISEDRLEALPVLPGRLVYWYGTRQLDVDGDGVDEMVVRDGHGGLVVFRSDRDDWERITLGHWGNDPVSSYDLVRIDGKPHWVAVTRWTIGLFTITGDEIWSIPIPGEGKVATGDLDGDGEAEIVVGLHGRWMKEGPDSEITWQEMGSMVMIDLRGTVLCSRKLWGNTRFLRVLDDGGILVSTDEVVRIFRWKGGER
jgi:hypothetical protein